MSSNHQGQSKQICPGPGEPGLVSVVLPTYNRAYSVGDTIESVLAQTYHPIEIIVVDDGSTDDTANVIARFGDKVRYIKQANGGVASARNTAFGLARGEFIAMIDSDDRWQPWKIELQVAFLRRHPEAGMVWTDMAAITDEGERVADTYLRTFYKAYERVRTEDIMTRTGNAGDLGVAIPSEFAGCPMWIGDVFSPLIRGTLMHTPTTLLRRERVRGTGGYDEDLRPNGEDFDFHLRTAVQGAVGFLDLPSIEYRIGHSDQLTAPSQAATMGRAYLKTVQRWMTQHPERVTLSKSDINEILAYGNLWVGSQALLAGDSTDARRHLFRSWRAEPQRLKTAVLLLLALLPQPAFQALHGARGRLRSAPR